MSINDKKSLTTNEKPAIPAVIDPYEHFLAEQKERVLQWKAHRAKKARVDSLADSRNSTIKI